MFKTIKNQKGITLVELLAVMVIVGIIAAISIPAIGNLIENTKKDAYIATAKNMQESARLVVSQNATVCETSCTVDFNATAVSGTTVPGKGYLENLESAYTTGKNAAAQVIVSTNATTGVVTYATTLTGTTNKTYKLKEEASLPADVTADAMTWTRDAVEKAAQ